MQMASKRIGADQHPEIADPSASAPSESTPAIPPNWNRVVISTERCTGNPAILIATGSQLFSVFSSPSVTR